MMNYRLEVSEDSERNMAILHCYPFTDSHSAVNIAPVWDTMMSNGPTGWNVNKERCRLVIIDSAANTVKTFNDLNISCVPCFAQNIQLELKDGLLSQRTVIDACSVACAVVGHFKYSSSVTDRLVAIQIELGLTQHRLIQDVATRWSSTNNML
jgi:hypothetical protein